MENQNSSKNIVASSKKLGGGVFPSPKTLIAACFLLYTSMMAAKGVFLAEISYIMKVFDVTKSTASLTNTYYFLAYAGTQVLLFFIIKRLDMRRFLAVTVPVAAIATALMGLSRGIADMYLLFAVCGVFQAGVYSGCNSTLTKFLPSGYLSLANSVMNFGYATGTVIAYGFSAFCVRYEMWRVPFFVMGGLLLAATLFFFASAGRAHRIKENYSDGARNNVKSVRDEEPFISPHGAVGMVLFYSSVLVITFFVTFLYYAVMNWISTLLVEVHSLSQDMSIYITTLAPILIALGPVMTIRYCDRHRDFIRCGAIFLSVCLPIPLLMAFLYDKSAPLAFVLSAIFVIVVNGVKSVGLSVMAFKLKSVIDTGEYSVITNAVASLAGGVAPTVIGIIIEKRGWSASYLTVFAICLAVLVTVFVIDAVIRVSMKKHERTPNEKIA